MGVEVEQGRVGAVAEGAGEDAELDSAIAPDDQRDLAAVERGLDVVGDAADDLDHAREVLGVPPGRVRGPARERKVAVIDHGRARRR